MQAQRQSKFLKSILSIQSTVEETLELLQKAKQRVERIFPRRGNALKRKSRKQKQNRRKADKISERFRQFCFFTKRSTLLLEKSRKINFLHLFFIEQHAKLLPFLLMLVDQVKSLKKVPF